ncbi:sigma factor-like helix-turn-helix DNA-binding protein [Streptosporangium sandarakinum]|uniref:RNA polymerase sigma factor 70 region 4 type 2 domain-containing protein n=1 Tax=Streptosporangium sandarakinum TaxID=1260955 RepID=A0A852V0X2_9ACTN|nr:sigma factor-like helix-turn-helix DNA-binding protein [Streptosporangium sandarakinum]NYF41318.1 hypothetical protein [Streptosporangium sandarakinum]
MAMLTLMERLSPNERVVYVLREAFGYAHREIAEILDITESKPAGGELVTRITLIHCQGWRTCPVQEVNATG